MDNFRDSYFPVTWDLTKKRIECAVWGKQYDTGRGLSITLKINGVAVAPSNEVIRLKWEKPDKTTGYVGSVIVGDKFIIENIDQMFTVHGAVRADLELQVADEFVASITFYASVEKAVAVDAVESSSEFTALQSALLDVGTVQDSLDGYVDAEAVRVANESGRVTAEGLRVSAETDREAAEALRQTGYSTMDEAIALKADKVEIEAARGTEATLGARLDSTDAKLAETASNLAEHKLDYAQQVGTVAGLATTSKEVVGAINEIDGEMGKLVASYVYNSNQEYRPTALDFATGTFTLAGHGLVDGIELFGTTNLDQLGVDPSTYLPGGFGYSTGYRVVNATTNTFQLATTTGGIAVVFTTLGDLSKWHLEKAETGYIEITNLPPYKKLLVNVIAFQHSGVWQSVYGGSKTTISWARGIDTPTSQHQPGFGSAGSYYNITSVNISLMNGYEYVDTYSDAYAFNSLTRATVTWKTFRKISNETYTNLNVEAPSRRFKNGTRVEVYRLG